MSVVTIAEAGSFPRQALPRYPGETAFRIAALLLAARSRWSALAALAGRSSEAVHAHTVTHVVAMVSRARGTASTVQSAAGAADTLDVRFRRDVVVQLDAAYNFARFLSRDADAAQDIVQEAFLRAYRSFDGYQGGDPRAWIFAIVRNCYHDWLLERRRKARHEIGAADGPDAPGPAVDDVASDDDDPETALLRQSDAGMVRAVLGDLPRQLREILVLREIEGLSYRQIAEVATLPIGTVMSRLARARAQFQIAWRRETGPREQRS